MVQEKLRAVFYARVSTEEERQLNALEKQIQENRDVISNNGWILVGEYIDEGKTGTTTKRRSAYKHLLADMTEGKFDIVVCKDQDRLQRNTLDWYLFVDNLVKNNLKLFMYLDNKFFIPSEDALITGIKAIIAEEYSRNLSKKLNNANRRRVEKALAGEEIAAMGNGKSLAFKIVNGKWVKDEKEAELGKKIFELYLEYDSIMHRLDAIVRSECFEKSKDLEDYEKIKDDLFIRLLNVEKNRAELDDAIFRTIGDIALVLYARMGELDGCSTSVKIKQHIFEKWDKDEQMAFNDALLNTYFISPPRIYCWEKLICNMDYEGENFMNLLFDEPLKKSAIGNCLSTATRTNGAVAVFLPGVAQRLSDLLDGGFYMVFTSIHEVMIHSEKTADPKDLKRVLADTVRDTTPDEDFLTYYVYHYNHETGQFTYY